MTNVFWSTFRAVASVSVITAAQSAATSPAMGQCDPIEIQELLGSGGEIGDVFGYAIDIDGDIAVVGADQADDLGPDAGAAYIFRWDGQAWNEEQKLLADGGQNGDHYGWSVAVAGDIVAIGTPSDDQAAPNAGAVYIYRFDGSTWVLEQKIVPDDAQAEDRFGFEVNLDREVALITSPGDDDRAAGAGSAYFFSFDGASWIQNKKVVASDGAVGDRFGFAAALDIPFAIIGAPDDQEAGIRTGAAYIFRFNTNNWVQQTKLLAPTPETDEWFGASVDVSGTSVIVGAYQDDGSAMDTGSAHIYRWTGSAWNLDASLTASDAALSDYFGRSVAIEGNVALVGADQDDDNGSRSGSAYFYRWNGSTWGDESKVVPLVSGAGDNFGTSVALSQTLGLVGAPFHPINEIEVGVVNVFEHQCTPVEYGLSVTGECPGILEVSWVGAQPGVYQGLAYGRNLGSLEIPEGTPCAGTILGISGFVMLVDPPGYFLSGSGSGSFSGPAGDSACGGYLQLVQSGNCETSNVVQIPQ